MATGYADAYAELADIYSSARPSAGRNLPSRMRAAIRLAQKALEIDPDCVLAHSVLARAYTSVLKYDLAAESERALQSTQRCEVMLARAAVLLWNGRIDESVATAERHAPHSSIGPEASLNLGCLSAGPPLRRAWPARGPARAPSTYPLLDLPLAAAYAELAARRRPGRRRAGRLKNPTSTWQASARASRTRPAAPHRGKPAQGGGELGWRRATPVGVMTDGNRNLTWEAAVPSRRWATRDWGPPFETGVRALLRVRWVGSPFHDAHWSGALQRY